jgi:TolB-like protein/DNA-binding winged helix-turn-helix (wHTH) protein/Tfp pilus assembly protein PilF
MATHDPPPDMYRFGLFEADGRTGELRKQGRPLKLRGRPFDILLLLLRRAGDVVTREELRQHLWPADTFVDFDHGLNSAVNRLREALGDSADNPRFVETLPKRGYRFVAPVEAVARVLAPPGPGPSLPEPQPPAVDAAAPLPETVPTPEASPRPSAGVLAVSRGSRIVLALAVAALVVAAAIAIRSLRPGASARQAGGKATLAVLPFENLSADPGQDFFSDGFTEEMIAELGKLDPEHLGVIARTTTMLYKNAGKTVDQIRQELGVEYVLEGSIRRSGDRIRITAQLVQATDMTHMWAESYDREAADVLGIQREVAIKIARSLTLALKRPPAAAGQSASFPAYELYLRGKFFREQATEEGARKAIEYFERAITLDPSYAPAHAGIADCYRLLGAPGWEVEQPATLLQKAKVGAERALALDMQSSEAHAVLAMVKLNYDWDLAGSEREIREAIRLNPNSSQAHQYYSSTLTTMGKFDEAVAEAHRALELDPLSPTAGTTLAIRYYYAGRTAEAMAQFSKTLEVNPAFAVAHWGLAQGYRRQGDAKRSIDELMKAVELSGQSAYMRAHLAYGLALAGERDRATAIQQELEVEGRERYASPYHFALIAAGFENRAGVITWLERALADRSGWMVFLPVEPEFDAMRDAPEIQRLLARVKPGPAVATVSAPSPRSTAPAR